MSRELNVDIFSSATVEGFGLTKAWYQNEETLNQK